MLPLRIRRSWLPHSFFNGDEGSQWAAPVVRDVMAAYFGVDQFAPEVEVETGTPLEADLPEIISPDEPAEQSP